MDVVGADELLPTASKHRANAYMSTIEKAANVTRNDRSISGIDMSGPGFVSGNMAAMVGAIEGGSMLGSKWPNTRNVVYAGMLLIVG